jgi:hypothetical protein
MNVGAQKTCTLTLLSHLNTPDFERAAADTFKGVAVALCAFHFYRTEWIGKSGGTVRDMSARRQWFLRWIKTPKDRENKNGPGCFPSLLSG